MKETGRSGPYQGKRGHLFYVVRYSDGSKHSVLVHREEMEKSLGRRLERCEVVHHKDGNPTNNKISNLTLTTFSEHAKIHAKPAEVVELVCLGCGKKFTREARIERHNRKQGKKGPYCGKRCAAREQVKIQGCIRGSKKFPEFMDLIGRDPSVSINAAAKILGIHRNTVINYRNKLKGR